LALDTSEFALVDCMVTNHFGGKKDFKCRNRRDNGFYCIIIKYRLDRKIRGVHMKNIIISIGAIILLLFILLIFLPSEDGYIFGDGNWIFVYFLSSFILLMLPGFSMIRLLSIPLNNKEILLLSIISSFGVNGFIALVLSYFHIPINIWVFSIVYVFIVVLSHFMKPFRLKEIHIQLYHRDALINVLSYFSLLFLFVISFKNFVVPASIFDASFHGLLTQRIYDTQSVLPSITNDGLYTPPMDGKFYPFGLHLHAALLMGVTGLPAYKTVFYLTLSIVSLFPIVMTFFMKSLTQRFIQDQKTLAYITIPLSMVYLCYSLFKWGGFPLFVGLVFLPVALAVLIQLLQCGSKFYQWALLLSLTLSGCYYVHISEVFTFILFAILITLFYLRNNKDSKIICKKYLAVTGFIIILILPTLPFLINLFRSTSKYMSSNHILLSLSDSILAAGWLYFDNNRFYVGMILLIYGILHIQRHKQMQIAFSLSLLVAFVYLIVSVYPESIIQYISFPYYNQFERVLYLLVYFVIFFSSLGVYYLLTKHGLKNKAVKYVLLIAISINLYFSVTTIKNNLESYQEQSLLTIEEWNTLQWMGENIPKSSPILNNQNDGSYWIPSITGHPTLLNQSQQKAQDFKDRIYLLKHIGEYPDNQRVKQLLGHYNTHYIFYSKREIEGIEQFLDIQAIERNSFIIELYKSQNNTVYYIKPQKEGDK
jgi:hypothetical protein